MRRVLRADRRCSIHVLAAAAAKGRWGAGWVSASAIVEADTGPGGIYARLAELGHRPVRFREELRARMPSADEAQRLQLAPATPVVVIYRTAFTADGAAVEVNEMILDSSAYVIEYAFDDPSGIS